MRQKLSIGGRKPFDLEQAPERVWLYMDVYGVLRAAVYGVLRAAVYGPHKSRPSVQYVRADIARTLAPES